MLTGRVRLNMLWPVSLHRGQLLDPVPDEVVHGKLQSWLSSSELAAWAYCAALMLQGNNKMNLVSYMRIWA